MAALKKTAKRFGLVGLYLICLVPVGAAAIPFLTNGPAEIRSL